MTVDRDELRKAAASRRSDVVQERAAVVWHCEFCTRDFQTENGLMRHFCQEREKLDLLRSPRGQAAYAHYSTWMRLQKRSVPPAETFMNSRQFNHMVKFADWADRTSIPNAEQFIRLMVQSGTQPALWCRDNTYALYLDWYDNAYPPEQQFVESLDFIKTHMSGENPFDEFTAQELTSLIRRRKLSPWLLIASGKFLEWARKQPPELTQMVNDAINFGAFINKIKAHPELATEFKEACKSEGL